MIPAQKFQLLSPVYKQILLFIAHMKNIRSWCSVCAGSVYLQLVESVSEGPVNTESWLYFAVLCKGLKHPWIFVSTGVLERGSPTDLKGQLY